MSIASLENLTKEAIQLFQTAKNSQNLYDIKVSFLGKNGKLTAIMKDMKNLAAQEKPLFGKKVNEVKDLLEIEYQKINIKLKDLELSDLLNSQLLDLSLPGPAFQKGSQHPIQLVFDEFIDIFSKIGFSVRLGPLMEKDFYNFEALNIPPDHPSRDMQDTFYISPTELLRTHTSPIQIHTMENEKPPIRILAPGSVFRRDSDISHSPQFHQVEGLLVDKKVSMSDLKGVLSYFIKEFFGHKIKTRFRPSFFPFTEPSAEVDCSCFLCDQKGCRMCKNTGWIEIGGSGLVHPQVFKSVGIEYPKYQGFAFGMGIERLAILKYGIEDIRLFFENDLRFLRQFNP